MIVFVLERGSHYVTKYHTFLNFSQDPMGVA